MEHATGPKPALYWLLPHCEHAAPFAPVYPALHSQAVLVVLTAAETEFEGQSEQSAGPKPTLYWLLPHCEHAAPFAPVYPALHSQAVLVLLTA